MNMWSLASTTDQTIQPLTSHFPASRTILWLSSVHQLVENYTLHY